MDCVFKVLKVTVPKNGFLKEVDAYNKLPQISSEVSENILGGTVINQFGFNQFVRYSGNSKFT